MSSGFAKQLVLFDCGPNFERLREAQERLMRANRTPSTLKAYALAWRDFDNWGRSAGRTTFPADQDTLCLYITSLLENPQIRLNTIRLRVSAIRIRHNDEKLPCDGIKTALFLIAHAARERQELPGGKRALTPEQLRRIAAFLEHSTDIMDIRDRAMITFGFALGWRSAELTALHLRDVKFVGDGMRVRLRYSKTDQSGKGREVGIPHGSEKLTCPVEAVRAWVERRGSFDGPLFNPIGPRGQRIRAENRRLHKEVVIDAIRRQLKHIGVTDLHHYGSHSLRVGMITASAEAGANLPAIMQRSGHRRVESVMEYIRPAQVFRVDPLAGVL